MITLQELQAKLDKLLEPALIKDHCPNGLQVEGHHEVRKIATAVSASLATVRAAVEWGADALIVHHGMFWEGQPATLVGPMREKAQLLLDHQVSLFGYHLPLDKHEEVGNNYVAAQALGLKHLEPFGDFGGVSIGVQGTIDPTDIREWVGQVETYYEHQAYQALGGLDDVQKVAIVSGGAHWKVTEAIEKGIDCFITGSFDEPIWHLAHEGNVHFLALGHSNTERVGPRALAEWLEKHTKAETAFVDVPNPF